MVRQTLRGEVGREVGRRREAGNRRDKDGWMYNGSGGGRGGEEGGGMEVEAGERRAAWNLGKWERSEGWEDV